MKEELFRSELIELDSDNKKWKAKCSELENKNKELLHDNQTLSKCYVSMKADEAKAKAKAEEAKAKEISIKQANKSEAQKCIVLASESLKKEDYAKAEKMYKKAAKLDLDINLGSLLYLFMNSIFKAIYNRQKWNY